MWYSELLEFGYLLIAMVCGLIIGIVILRHKQKQIIELQHPVNFFSKKNDKKLIISELNKKTQEKVSELTKVNKELLKTVEHVSKQRAKIMSHPSRKHEAVFKRNKTIIITTVIVSFLLVVVLIFVIVNPLGW